MRVAAESFYANRKRPSILDLDEFRIEFKERRKQQDDLNARMKWVGVAGAPAEVRTITREEALRMRGQNGCD